jgi:hypothetical protein
MNEIIRKEHRKSNEEVVKIAPGKATVVEFTPSGLLIKTYPLPYQGLVLVATAGTEKFMLVEATIDEDYVKVFESFDKLRKYVKDTYGIELESP